MDRRRMAGHNNYSKFSLRVTYGVFDRTPTPEETESEITDTEK